MQRHGGDKSELLSLARTRVVREALEKEGVANKIAAKGMGCADDKGPRCELAVCEPEEVAAIEAEVAAMEAKAKEAEEPVPKLKIVFKKGEERVYANFVRKPLGFTYISNEVPMILTKVAPGSHAEALGVKVGMQVVEINGASMEGVTFPWIHQQIVDGARSLPA